MCGDFAVSGALLGLLAAVGGRGDVAGTKTLIARIQAEIDVVAQARTAVR